jgi:hypothetical protein
MFSKAEFCKDMIRLLQDERIIMKRKKAYISYLERQLLYISAEKQNDLVKFEYNVILDLR